jgi:hypothetical protein
MNAKHSAILLTGLLLLMIGIAWAQSTNTTLPTCPPFDDEIEQQLHEPTAWARADWNAKSNRWDIDCSEMRSMATIPASNAAYNTTSNALNAIPGRTPARSSGNFANTNAYNAQLGNGYSNPYLNANMPAQNATNARRPRSVRREPNTRKPGE